MLRHKATGLLLVAAIFLLQSQAGEANWFTDLFTSSKAEEAHGTVFNETPNPSAPQQNKGSWTHELIAAAAGWEAWRAYERHQAKNTGQQVSHSHIKGVLAGFAAAAVDRLVETKGLDWLDAQRAKTRATQQAESVVAEKHGLNLFGSSAPSNGGARVNTPNWQNGVRDADPEALGLTPSRNRADGQYQVDDRDNRNYRTGDRDYRRNEDNGATDQDQNDNRDNRNYRTGGRDYRRNEEDRDVNYSVRDTVTYAPDGEYR